AGRSEDGLRVDGSSRSVAIPGRVAGRAFLPSSLRRSSSRAWPATTPARIARTVEATALQSRLTLSVSRSDAANCDGSRHYTKALPSRAEAEADHRATRKRRVLRITIECSACGVIVASVQFSFTTLEFFPEVRS